MTRIYFDASAAIYFVEQIPPWYPRIAGRLAAGAQIVVSDLTRMESVVLPIRQGNAALLAKFRTLFAGAEIVPMPAAVFDRAADIRAAYGYKTPDALHLAAAVEGGCDVFLTNDAGLTAFPDVRVELA